MLAIVVVALPLLLRAVSTFSSDSCEDCDHNEPWRPLFKPSQIIHSEFPEHRLHRSLEIEAREGSHERGPPVVSGELTSPPSPQNSIDTRVKSYSSGGRRWVEWDHYGDVTTARSQSYEDKDNLSPGPGDGSRAPPNSRELDDFLAKSREQNFFDEDNLFKERSTPSREMFSDDLNFSKEFSFSNEAQSSGSFEPMASSEGLSRYRAPVATSYSSMSSVFTGVRPQPRELRTPISLNDLSRLIKKHPVSQSRFYNGRNVTKQYLVHELHPSPVDQSGPLNLSARSRPPPYVPLSHPVYRYVKPTSPPSRHHDEDGQPYIRLQNHHTLIHHVVPTKDPFSELFWKGFKRNVHEPPTIGRTLYIVKKKPKGFDLKRIKRRQSHNNYVYIIKSNTRLS